MAIGKYERKFIDYSGQKYGMLTLNSELERKVTIQKTGWKNTKRYYECKCDCGNIVKASLGDLRTGDTTSCGCSRKKPLSHGLTHTRIYRIWHGIITRCKSKTQSGYKNYGGRGIKVDESWLSFEKFYEDMKEGYSDNLTIERNNVNGNYCKENCKWVTLEEQYYNKRNSRMIEYKGEIKCLTKWCVDLCLPKNTIRNRIKKGWSIERAFTTLIKQKYVS